MKRIAVALLLAASLAHSLTLPTTHEGGGELRFCLRGEPKTFDPRKVADDHSETVRYLTGGVLVRLDRITQRMTPELAESWKIDQQGRRITFKLREGVRFSDGTIFDAQDVAFTFTTMMDPAMKSPTGDSFRTGPGEVRVEITSPYKVSVVFPAPVAGLERLLDQVAIMSSRSPQKELAVLGPFLMAEHKPGIYILLKRNPYYFKTDAQGRRLPYLDSVRLDIQQNRDLELMRFEKGEVHLINSLDAESYNRLNQEMPAATRDIGPSLDSEQLWFNQVSSSPVPAYKIAWFRSKNFRRAIAEAIQREDLARVVYLKRAAPAVGPVSPSNQYWFEGKLKPYPYDRASALRRLQADGFRNDNGVLRDASGHPVEFSVITNAGNKARERMAAMIQQDLAQIGIKLNVVPLDFPSLIDRITQNFNYEACLLGLINVDPDPNAQMNIWMSSAENHQWNPSQKKPETSWEAEVDRLMQVQASASDDHKRKAAFDKVQEIAWEEAPFIYLVNMHALSAVAPGLRNVTPSVLRPQTYWNVEYLYFEDAKRASK
jgi:peptide/nickel transport system substrate-binding protein